MPHNYNLMRSRIATGLLGTNISSITHSPIASAPPSAKLQEDKISLRGEPDFVKLKVGLERLHPFLLTFFRSLTQ